MNETIKQIILAKLEERRSELKNGASTQVNTVAETRYLFQFALNEMDWVIEMVNSVFPNTFTPANTKWIASKDPRPFLKDEVVFSKRRGIGHVDYVDDEGGNLAVKFTNEYWYDRNGNSLEDPSNEAESIYHCNAK